MEDWMHLKYSPRVYICSMCNIPIGAKKVFIRHLKLIHNMDLNEFGLKVNKLTELPKCKNLKCQKPGMPYNIKYNTFQGFCSKSCIKSFNSTNKSQSHKDKLAKSCTERNKLPKTINQLVQSRNALSKGGLLSNLRKHRKAYLYLIKGKGLIKVGASTPTLTRYNNVYNTLSAEYGIIVEGESRLIAELEYCIKQHFRDICSRENYFHLSGDELYPESNWDANKFIVY